MASTLTYSHYGKDKVRVFRIVRDEKWHNVVEYSVTALLEGDVETSYTQADNTVVVATDSIKNITNYFTKTSPHVLNPELFALHLGTFFVSKYSHIHKAFITVEKLRWSRIAIKSEDGSKAVDHPHAFLRDGDDKRIIEVEIDATAGKDKIIGKVTSGIKDLLVLKSTGSAFENFYKDEYTTLVPVDDRIFSTAVDLNYTYAPLSIPAPTDEKKLEFTLPTVNGGAIWDGEAVADSARTITLEVFATDESASVQATLYKMAQRVVAENEHVTSVTYTLPNKHYIPVDMKYIGIDNLTPGKAEVFTPIAAPSGLISATISRV